MPVFGQETTTLLLPASVMVKLGAPKVCTTEIKLQKAAGQGIIATGHRCAGILLTECATQGIDAAPFVPVLLPRHRRFYTRPPSDFGPGLRPEAANQKAEVFFHCPLIFFSASACTICFNSPNCFSRTSTLSDFAFSFSISAFFSIASCC